MGALGQHFTGLREGAAGAGRVHQSVSQLVSSLSDLGSQLDFNLAQAQQTHVLQQGNAEAAAQLAYSLAELSAAAHNEIQNISGTAEGIRENMLGAAAEALGPDWLAWGRAFALWACGVILRGKCRRSLRSRLCGSADSPRAVDPSNLEHLATLPTVRALIVTIRVTGWAVRIAASSSVSMVLLALSARRWLATLLASSQDLESSRCVSPRRATALIRRPLVTAAATPLARNLRLWLAQGRSPLSAGLSGSAIRSLALYPHRYLQMRQDAIVLESPASQTGCAFLRS
ncbi:uncharacterized protein B0H18DRAFT_982743 [Fomitopsis serialis]|uniref:uncharacterized protein n=1 Tax=Fomitopsis serialis TaxID=139415 RepID=UPI0020084D08|nr:uncharacterized protein B0H18DRAFT_982743 [Neoantrodia serialis]KAH9933913.1 hypothetical protein B0H18DRAFT_982743 [Neoantrodia serialis]